MLDSTAVYISQQVQDILGQLALAFGTTVEYLWPIMVKAAFAKALGDLFISIILWAVTIALFHKYAKNIKAIPLSGHYEPTSWDVTKTTHMVMMWVTLITSVIYCACTWSGMVIGLFAPEYKALETVLRALK